jgi:hypothetical protein
MNPISEKEAAVSSRSFVKQYLNIIPKMPKSIKNARGQKNLYVPLWDSNKSSEKNLSTLTYWSTIYRNFQQWDMKMKSSSSNL